MYKVFFYTTVMSLRICLERKKQFHSYVFQELCLHFRTPPLLLYFITAVNAIPPISVGSTEIPLWIYQKVPGSPNDVVQQYTKVFFSKFKHREKPQRSCPVDCMRKSKKVSSYLSHRWFCLSGKPLSSCLADCMRKTIKVSL